MTKKFERQVDVVPLETEIEIDLAYRGRNVHLFVEDYRGGM